MNLGIANSSTWPWESVCVLGEGGVHVDGKKWVRSKGERLPVLCKPAILTQLKREGEKNGLPLSSIQRASEWALTGGDLPWLLPTLSPLISSTWIFKKVSDHPALVIFLVGPLQLQLPVKPTLLGPHRGGAAQDVPLMPLLTTAHGVTISRGSATGSAYGSSSQRVLSRPAASASPGCL